MLMTQRAWTEGARVLAQWTALLIDQAKWHDDEAERNNANTLLELLTPIVKGFLSENAQFSTSLALQVFGGHGYVTETGIEQLVRDVRITTIYEGTTGIQAQDLLMRKIVSSNGERFQVLDEQLTRWLRESGSDPALEAFTSPLRSLQQRVGRITAELLAKERSHPGWALGACTNYLRLIGHLVLAWSWARIARAAQAHENSGDSWYALKLETAQFYFSQLAPETLALEQAIQAGLADNSDMLTRVIEDF
jgi:hypothetical protein